MRMKNVGAEYPMSNDEYPMSKFGSAGDEAEGDGGLVGGDGVGVGDEDFVVGAAGEGEVDDGVGVPVGDDEGFLGEGLELAILDDGAGEGPRGLGQRGVVFEVPDERFGAGGFGFVAGRPVDEDVDGRAVGRALADFGHGLAAFESGKQQRGLEVEGIEGEDEDGFVDLAREAAGEDFDGAGGLVDPAGGADGLGGGVEFYGTKGGNGAFPLHGRGLGLGLGADGVDDGLVGG